MNTLHPLVALSPLVGLAGMVVCHILGTRLTQGTAHLGPIIMGMLVALIAALFVAVEGTSRMLLLPGDSPMGLWVMVALATISLGYGYFTFVNLNTTSLRIRIMRELAARSAGSVKESLLLSAYSGADVVRTRIQRLRAWRQVEIREGRITVNPGIFMLLEGIIAQLRALLLQDGRLKQRGFLQMSGFMHQRRLIRLLWIYLGLALAAFYYTGITSELHKNVTERARYHAIPVALSQIYHNRTHDYTAWKDLAVPFQGGEDIHNLISRSINSRIDPNGPVYYWLADDRGFSDLVNLSFRIFGTTMLGLFNGFFALVVLSIGIAGWGLRRWPPALAVLVLFVAAYASFLPIINAAAGSSVVQTNYSVHISETRTYEVLGMVFLLQAACSAYFIRRLRFDECFFLAIQGMIFGFLFSCRSSLGWIVLSAALLAFVFFLKTIYKTLISHQGIGSATIARTLWVGGSLLAIIWGTLFFKGMHHALGSPVYLDWGGGRTFYHNALMGVKHLKWLEGNWGVDDAAAIDNVNRWLDSQGLSKFDRQELLNSLGGHATANWDAYERSAMNFYQDLWKKDPVGMILNYLKKGLLTVAKVRSSFVTVIIADNKHKAEGEPAYKIFNGGLFRPEVMFVALVPCLAIALNKRFLAAMIAFMVVIFGFALIPGTAFYSGTLTTTGASVLSRMLAFCAATIVISKIPSLFSTVSGKPSVKKHGDRRRFYLVLLNWSVLVAFLLWLFFPNPILTLFP